MEISGIMGAARPLPAQTPSRTEPGEAATRRFEALMNDARPDTPATASTQPGLPFPVDAVPDAAPTLGERILNGVQGATADYSRSWQAMSEAANGLSSKTSLPDLLRLQVNFSRVSVNSDLLSKVGGRMTQNVDSLVKLT